LKSVTSRLSSVVREIGNRPRFAVR
jgi:hypothetical protein